MCNRMSRELPCPPMPVLCRPSKLCPTQNVARPNAATIWLAVTHVSTECAGCPAFRCQFPRSGNTREACTGGERGAAAPLSYLAEHKKSQLCIAELAVGLTLGLTLGKRVNSEVLVEGVDDLDEVGVGKLLAQFVERVTKGKS